MTGRRSLALLVATATAVALLPAALAGAAVPAGADRDAAQERTEHARILAYWTPERMRAAIPRDFVRHPDGTFRLEPTPMLDPASSSGKSWTTTDGKGGVVQARTGKVYFVMGRTGYVCSGSVADDGGAGTNSLVLTAGHCLYDGKKYSRTNELAGFATNWLFIPDFDSLPNLNTTNCALADTKYGCWTAKALVVHRGFASQRNFTSTATRYDFGFAVVGAGGKSSGALDVAVGGSYAVDTDPLDNSPKVTDVLSAFGYPAGSPYGGKDLVYCSGPITTDANNADATWGMPCDMTGGSSGGPWLAGVDSTGAGGTLSSLNSYGYSGVKYMYGPMFNKDTKAVYDAALLRANGTASGSAVVVTK